MITSQGYGLIAELIAATVAYECRAALVCRALAKHPSPVSDQSSACQFGI
jgi:hypothetical protein